MAKNVILDVLENTIGRYVLNLDAGSLNVALWSGKVELRNLKLNVDVVNSELHQQAIDAPNLAPPFRLISGGFEALEVGIPWTKIASKAVTFRARGLSVILEPYDFLSQASSYTPSSSGDKDSDKKKKDQRLQDTEQANDSRLRANALRKLVEVENEEETSSFSGRLTTRIIENLQVEISDVSISLRGCGCSIGADLESLLFMTTDDKGNRTFVDRTGSSAGSDSFLYKELQITGFSVYCDEYDTTVSSAKNSGVQSVTKLSNHSYILEPSSFQATLRQSDSNNCVDFPKYLFNAKLSELGIRLSKNQLELVNQVAIAIKPKNVSRPLFPEYRPSLNINPTTAKQWWQYAYRSIGRLNRRRSWAEFFIAYKKRKRYIPLYKRSAHYTDCEWLEPLAEDEVIELTKIDKDKSISIVGIMTWRDIADAQFELEKKTREQREKNAAVSSIFSFFGSSKKVDPTADDPPITLTEEEMKELEAVSLGRADDVSTDTLLYDAKFTLESFVVDLINSSAKPLLKFQMGTVAASLLAKNDGSFTFNYTLSRMQVDDLVTENTVFPSIISSFHQSSSSTVSLSSPQHAFEFRLKKSKDGDQDVLFEVVASPLLLSDMKSFFIIEEDITKKTKGTSFNSNETEFYDAIEDETSFSLINETATAAASVSNQMSGKLADALADAWKNKQEKKQNLKIDCSIHAPIIVIPESCSSPEKPVLVLNMGHFHFKSRSRTDSQVDAWFKSRNNSPSEEIEIETYSLGMENLTVLVGTAGKCDWRESYADRQDNDGNNKISSNAIIQPLSIVLNIGMEKDVILPRTCVFGLLPSISVQTSPQEISRILSVTTTWTSFLEQMTDESKTYELEANVQYQEKTVASKEESIVKPLSFSDEPYSGEENEVTEILHVSVALGRLSAVFAEESGESLEAHLVSVVASMTSSTDTSSCSRLRMGWFWVLDKLHSDLPRRQRLLAHSLLPHSAASYSINDEYNIIGELSQLGVFDSSYSGSSDLADITLTTSKGSASDNSIIARKIDHLIDGTNMLGSLTVIDASFSSLFVNWNPEAIKNLMLLNSKLMGLIETPNSKNVLAGSVPTKNQLAGKNSQKSLNPAFSLTKESESLAEPKKIGEVLSVTIINAKLNKLELNFHSARDDLPLFVMAMFDPKIKMCSTKGDDENLDASISLGNFGMETPMARANEEYKNMIGLKPNESASLLTVRYTEGIKAVASHALPGVETENCVACAHVELSSMKVVFVQAQILFFLDYLNDGILGALAAQAASSAAGTAIEAAQPDAGEKLFQITAHGFEIIVPQAANAKDHIKLNINDLLVRFRSLANFAGSKAELSLRNVSMESSNNVPFVDTPIRMSISVFIPPDNAPTVEDQAMIIEMNFSEAAFLLSREQYAQIMLTLDGNIGETDPFLRAEENVMHPLKNTKPPDVPGDALSKQNENPIYERNEIITHDAKTDSAPKRMYVRMKFEVLSLNIIGRDESKPIISLAAVKTNIDVKMLPDQEKMVVEMTLHNVCIEDKRITSTNRDFRNMVSRIDDHPDQDDASIQVDFVKYENESMNLNVIVGSYQLVILPDVISEVLTFSDIGDLLLDKDQVPSRSDYDYKDAEREKVSKAINYGDSCEIKVPLSEGKKESKMEKTSISLKTSDVRIVLVGLDNEMTDDTINALLMKTTKPPTETIVFQGKIDIAMVSVTEIKSDTTTKKTIECNGNELQIYVSQGKEFSAPVQILEPASYCVALGISVGNDNIEEVELNMDMLSPIDLKLSMQDVALLNAILFYISDSLQNDDQEEEEDIQYLSHSEVSQITNLSFALQQKDDKEAGNTAAQKETFVETKTDRSSSVNVPQTTRFVRNVRFNLSVPYISLTTINDLHGIDIALFKFIARALVGKGSVRLPAPSSYDQGTSIDMTMFDFNLTSIFLADYYDVSSNLWYKFLDEPWKVKSTVKRYEEPLLKSKRLKTTIGIDSQDFQISFSEQFLVSIGAANNTWSLYSSAMEKAMSDIDSKIGVGDLRSSPKPNLSKNAILSTPRQSAISKGKELSSKKSTAANAAKALVTTLPYCIDNHTGIDVYFSIEYSGGESNRRTCGAGKTEYFEFELFPANGIGGERVYGQDSHQLNTVEIYVQEKKIVCIVDAAVATPRSAYNIGGSRFIFLNAIKTGGATIIYLQSHLSIYNSTCVPFKVALLNNENVQQVGICQGRSKTLPQRERSKNQSYGGNLSSIGGLGSKDFSKQSSSLGIPADLLDDFDIDQKDSKLQILVSPDLNDDATASSDQYDSKRWGVLPLPPLHNLLQKAMRKNKTKLIDVMCHSSVDQIKASAESATKIVVPGEDGSTFCVQMCLRATIVDGAHPFVEVFLQPRMVLKNVFPVSLLVRTQRLSYAYAYDDRKGSAYGGVCYDEDKSQIVHIIDPSQSIEIFSPNDSFALSIKVASDTLMGPKTGWVEWKKNDFVDLPLGVNHELEDPLHCLLPFVAGDNYNEGNRGIEFIIREDVTTTTGSSPSIDSKQQKLEVNNQSSSYLMIDDESSIEALKEVEHTPYKLIRTILLSTENVAYDFTGDFTIEPYIKGSKDISVKQWSTFSCTHDGCRITLLPGSAVPICLLQCSSEKSARPRRSLPFKIDDISIGNGGLDSSPIMWDDNTLAESFAYRQFRRENEFDIHIVPEFVVFNGSPNMTIMIKKTKGFSASIKPGKIIPTHRDTDNCLVIMIEIPELGGVVNPINVESLGLKVCVVTSIETGQPLGSLAVQTVVGSKDSRFAIKIGPVKFGERVKTNNESSSDSNKVSNGVFDDDIINIELIVSTMQLTLYDTQAVVSSAENKILKQDENENREIKTNAFEQSLLPKICQITLTGIALSYKRIFKDDKAKSSTLSAEKCAIAMMLKNMTVLNCIPNARHPVIFDSSATKNLLDAKIDLDGPIGAEMVVVELVDIFFAYSTEKKQNDTIVIGTDEDFIWSLIDVIDRINIAISDMCDSNIDLDLNEETGEYIISGSKNPENLGDIGGKDGLSHYDPPQSDKLFNVKKIHISPVSLVVSFRRKPRASRYEGVVDTKGAIMLGYAVKKLKFTLDKGHIYFKGYIGKNIKGPPDHIAEIVQAVYISMVKKQALKLIAATSFLEWKTMTARKKGGDEYVEGDVLRFAGNVCGVLPGKIIEVASHGIGSGIKNVTGSFGNRIQDATEFVGIGKVGSGINKTVTGTGNIVGGGIQGVGGAAGNVLRFTGNTVGNLFGHIGGAVESTTNKAIGQVGSGIKSVGKDGGNVVKDTNKNVGRLFGHKGDAVEKTTNKAKKKFFWKK